MTLGKALLDRLLALKQPIHRRVEGVLVHIGDAEVLTERRVGPGPRHAELARRRRDDALRHHRHDKVALPRGAHIDQPLKAQTLHRRHHRHDVAVGARAHHLQPVLDGAEPLALEDAPDCLDLVERKRRQIGQGALPDVLAVAHALTKQIRWP